MDIDGVTCQNLGKHSHDVDQVAVIFAQNSGVIAAAETEAIRAGKGTHGLLFQQEHQEAVNVRQFLLILIHRQPLEPDGQNFVHVNLTAIVLQDLRNG